MCKLCLLFRLNTEVLVEFGDGSAISIRKILHQLAFLQQEDAGGDVGPFRPLVAKRFYLDGNFA